MRGLFRLAVSTALLGAAVSLGSASTSWANWSDQQTCNPVNFVTASNETDVVAAVLAATASGQRVRVIGAGHSFSPIDLTTGVMIQLLAPANISEAVVLLGGGVVRVHAGLHLWQLNAALEELGLALPNLGAIANQTLAGAVNTNTHGTGATGGLSSFIVGMRLVLANGTAVTATATQNPDLFATARTGYGAYGVLIGIDIQTAPMWRMELVQAPIDLDVLLSMLPALLQQYDRLQWFFTPYAPGNQATLEIRANTSAPITGCWSGSRYSKPVTPPPAGMSAWPAGTTACVDVSYKTLTGSADDAQKYTEMEMMVEAASHLAVVRDFLAFQQRVQPQHNAAVELFTGVRYVLADDIPLSPFYRRDTAVISMIVLGNATYGGDLGEVSLYDRGLQDIAFGYGGRPHPGKMNWFDQDMMRHVYNETFDYAVGVMRAADPNGAFQNPYLQTLFGTGAAA